MDGTVPLSNNALEGFTRAVEQLEKTAERIASISTAPNEPADMVNLGEEMLNLLEARNILEVNLEARKVTTEVERYVIDVIG